MRIMQKLRAPAAGLFTVLAMGACDILDVTNPNALTEESIQQEAAANAVVNGAQRLVFNAISNAWQPYLVASDEMFYIGSRDGWGQIDKGFIADPINEFNDAAYPLVAQARWMADNAVNVLQTHVDENPGNASFATDLARAHLYAGIIYMVVGEIQEDFTISDKRDAGAPVGPAQMATMFDIAIQHLDAAISGSSGDLQTQARAVRARAHHSKAIWAKLNPSASGSNGLVSSAAAGTDAAAVIAAAGGNTADWAYQMTFSSGSTDNDMAAWVNSRKENQFSTSLVTLDASNNVTGVAMMDPVDNVTDPAVKKKMDQWKGGDLTTPGNQYAPLDLATTRLMHLILAENALAASNTGVFRDHINHIRAMDGLSDFTGQISDIDMLEHTRRVNLMIMGLRFADMYRFGIEDPRWDPPSDAIQSPGMMFPISITEIRANCNLNGQGC